MLTDYHVHLRPDGHEASAEDYFTEANVERYRAAAGGAGIAELGVSEHIHRFEQVLDVWDHPFWRGYARDDIDAYCAFVRERDRPAARPRGRLRAGRRGSQAEPDRARDFDYVVGSVHFLGELAVDMDDFDVWDSGRSVEEVWRRYFETLAEAARSGLFDILAHPDLVKMWGAERPLPDGDLRRYYEPALDGDRRVGHRRRGLDRGAAQAGRRDLPGAGVPGGRARRRRAGRALERRAPSAAHRLRLRRRRSSCSTRSACASWRCSSVARVGWSRSARPSGPREHARRHRLRLPPPRRRPAAGARRRRARAETRPRRALRRRRAHARVIDALLGAAGLGDIGMHFPDSDERWRDADSIELLRARRRACSTPSGFDDRQRRRDDRDGGARSSAPRASAIRERLAEALRLDARRVNVKATHRRGDRLRRARRGRRGARRRECASATAWLRPVAGARER